MMRFSFLVLAAANLARAQVTQTSGATVGTNNCALLTPGTVVAYQPGVASCVCVTPGSAEAAAYTLCGATQACSFTEYFDGNINSGSDETSVDVGCIDCGADTDCENNNVGHQVIYSTFCEPGGYDAVNYNGGGCGCGLPSQTTTQHCTTSDPNGVAVCSSFTTIVGRNIFTPTTTSSCVLTCTGGFTVSTDGQSCVLSPTLRARKLARSVAQLSEQARRNAVF